MPIEVPIESTITLECCYVSTKIQTQWRTST